MNATYFHGGKPGRKRGEFILPPCITKSPSCSDNGNRMFLGHFDTAEAAGYAYEDARKEIHGKFSPIYVAPTFVCEEFKGEKS